MWRLAAVVWGGTGGRRGPAVRGKAADELEHARTVTGAAGNKEARGCVMLGAQLERVSAKMPTSKPFSI